METILNRGRNQKLLFWFAIIVVGLLLLLPSINILASEIGGYASEKLVERSGVASSSLVIGAGNPQIDVGMGPAVSTLPATGVTIDGHAILHGNLSSLNGFPSADIWFEWGYDTNCSNTVGSQVAGAVGNYNCNLAGYDPNEIVYYRFAGNADGTIYGQVHSFGATGRAAGFSLMQIVLLIVIALAIVVTVFLLASSGNWIAALIAAIVGIIGFVVIQSMIVGAW